MLAGAKVLMGSLKEGRNFCGLLCKLKKGPEGILWAKVIIYFKGGQRTLVLG